MNNNILLSVENVVKKYGDYTALNNASISVSESAWRKINSCRRMLEEKIENHRADP